MEQRINIAELLKDCPSDMELDCTIWDSEAKVFFKRVLNDDFAYPIEVTVKYNNNNEDSKSFTKYGAFNDLPYCKCVIFPKGKTTWEGFQRPFKDGDVIFTHADCTRIGLGRTWISIFEENRNGGVATYVDYCNEGKDFYTYLDVKGLLCLKEDIIQQRLANEEEKAKLFQAIEDNGYRWNKENKTLEKLPKFKDGDVIYNAGIKAVAIFNKQTDMNTISHCFLNILGDLRICHYHSKDLSDWRLATENEKQELFDAIKAHGYKWNSESKTLEKLVEPRFKVGDKIRHKITNKNDIYEISKVYDDSYGIVGFTWMIYIKYQDNYELVPKKFDITTLKPFESKVLVRDVNGDNWIGAFYSHYKSKSKLFYVIGNVYYYQCIPYEGNEHLLGTNNDCDEFYKNW